MDFRDFLGLAKVLHAGSTEAEWRSAVSRAYYAAFHVSVELLHDLGFAVPRAEQAHAYLWKRLSNSGEPDIVNAGRNLKAIRHERNRADYDGHRPYRAVTAGDVIQTDEEIIRALDSARIKPIRTSITAAMKSYERDVLQEVTWHS